MGLVSRMMGLRVAMVMAVVGAAAADFIISDVLDVKIDDGANKFAILAIDDMETNFLISNHKHKPINVEEIYLPCEVPLDNILDDTLGSPDLLPTPLLLPAGQPFHHHLILLLLHLLLCSGHGEQPLG